MDRLGVLRCYNEAGSLDVAGGGPEERCTFCCQEGAVAKKVVR